MLRRRSRSASCASHGRSRGSAPAPADRAGGSPGLLLTLQNRCSACSYVGSGPLNGLEAKSGRPSLLTRMTAIVSGLMRPQDVRVQDVVVVRALCRRESPSDRSTDTRSRLAAGCCSRPAADRASRTAGTSTFCANAFQIRSYRSPRLRVSRPPILQSSCTHAAVLPHVQRREERRLIGDADLVVGRDAARAAFRCPGVGVERVGENLLDVGRNRSVVGGDHAAAAVAVARVVQQVEILATGLHVVPAGRRRRTSRSCRGTCTRALIAKARQVVVAAGLEAAERDVRAVSGDAVGRLPVLRPDGQALLLDAVGGVPGSELVQRSVAEHLRELADDVGRLSLRWRWSRTDGSRFPGRTVRAGSCGSPSPSGACSTTTRSRRARHPASRSCVPSSSTLKAGYGVCQIEVSGWCSYS